MVSLPYLAVIDILFIIEVTFSNCFSTKSCGFIDTFLPECVVSLNYINGDVLVPCPINCLSNFSLFNTLFAASMASFRLFIGNKIQYSLLCKVFLNNSKISGSP